MLLSLFYAGMTAVLADPAGNVASLENSFKKARVRAFAGIRKAHLLRITCPFLRRLPLKVVSAGFALPGEKSWAQAAGGPALDEREPMGEERDALLTFTTGSTGNSKAIGRSLRQLEIQQDILVRELGLKAGRMTMPGLPAFILSFLAAGCTVVLPEIPGGRLEKVPYRKLLEQMQRHAVDLLLASPYFCRRLAREAQRRSITLPALWDLYTGGGPMTPRTVQILRESFPGARITAIYGSSEAEPIAGIEGNGILSRRGKTAAGAGLPAGRPIPEVEVLILKPNGAELDFRRQDGSVWTQDPGVIGEITVRGPHVNTHYPLDPEAQAGRKIPDREGTWHRTGDAGYLDEDGLLWLCGPVSQSVQWKGRTIYPGAVEAALEERGAVRECALVSWEIDGQRHSLLAWVAPRKVGRNCLEEAMAALGLEGFPAREIRRIPRDARHRTKIDTAALLKTFKAVRT